MKTFSLGLALCCAFAVQAGETNTGQAAPDCKAAPLGGGVERTLGQLRGKVVYLDFWASWCGPCAQSFPFMNRLQQELGPKGLEVVGVNLDENREDAKTFLAETPGKFTLLADNGGQCARDFGVKAMPSSYLIDRDGVIREIHLGFKPGEAEQFRQQVESLLARPAAGKS